MSADDSVTGFSLFVLCHDFGRRGRAMARSLARRAESDLPLELTVFYHRTEDAQLVTEGALDGPAPTLLRLIPVPPGDILRRAMLFSRAHRMHGLSHTVFCDSDLWFPPAFWKQYAAAIRGESPGYWSCCVMNIPWDSSETFVDQWTAITPEALEAEAEGRRYDKYGGQVGHFQCIPRELVEYPSNQRAGVSETDLEFSKIAITQSACRRDERRLGPRAYHFDHPPVWEGTHGLQL